MARSLFTHTPPIAHSAESLFPLAYCGDKGSVNQVGRNRDGVSGIRMDLFRQTPSGKRTS